jgi:hypothetical protein
MRVLVLVGSQRLEDVTHPLGFLIGEGVEGVSPVALLDLYQGLLVPLIALFLGWTEAAMRSTELRSILWHVFPKNVGDPPQLEQPLRLPDHRISEVVIGDELIGAGRHALAGAELLRHHAQLQRLPEVAGLLRGVVEWAGEQGLEVFINHL